MLGMMTERWRAPEGAYDVEKVGYREGPQGPTTAAVRVVSALRDSLHKPLGQLSTYFEDDIDTL